MRNAQCSMLCASMLDGLSSFLLLESLTFFYTPSTPSSPHWSPIFHLHAFYPVPFLNSTPKIQKSISRNKYDDPERKAICNAMHRTMRTISVAMKHCAPALSSQLSALISSLLAGPNCWWSHGSAFHAYSRELLPVVENHSRGNHDSIRFDSILRVANS